MLRKLFFPFPWTHIWFFSFEKYLFMFKDNITGAMLCLKNNKNKKSILIHQIQNKIHSNFSFSLYTAFYANQPSSTSKNSFLYFSFISPKGNHSLDIEQRTERGSEHVASEKRGKEKWNFFHFTEHRRRTEEWECCSFL